MIKLPKQWKHWCKKNNLRPHFGGRRQHDWFYLKGQGRVWRINSLGMLQCGDTYEDFDRWALCDIEEAPLPLTEKCFEVYVAVLITRKNKKIPQHLPIDEGEA